MKNHYSKSVDPKHDIVTATYAFHPDGSSFRGAAIVSGGVTSVCKHAHTTETGALRCARSKRAAYKRGEWAPLP